MSLARPDRFRRGALAVAAALALAACSGSGGDDGGSGDGAPGGEPGEAEMLTLGGVDLGGEALDPASDVESNLLPDLVVDDVGRGKKVNLRNIFPSEKPVLLWMWAPH